MGSHFSRDQTVPLQVWSRREVIAARIRLAMTATLDDPRGIDRAKMFAAIRIPLGSLGVERHHKLNTDFVAALAPTRDDPNGSQRLAQLLANNVDHGRLRITDVCAFARSLS
jgi:hypothetical protein